MRVRTDPYIWLVLAFSLFAILPLAGPDYFFDAHDAPHTVFYLTEFDAALRDGVWYPGWATNQALGYGYPTFVFYSPLAYYVAEGFHLVGAAKVVAIKWTWALATVGAGLAMYAFARKVMGRQRGLLAAIIYIYIPYHLVDIYVRGALAEYSAFVWMPLALLAFHQLVKEATMHRIGLAALAYGALFMSHNVTAIAFTPLLAAYAVYRLLTQPGSSHERLKKAVACLAAALLAFGIAAALLLPGFLERAYINQEQWVRASYDYALHFVQPAHLFSAAWGYAPGVPGTEGGQSVQLGAVPLLLAIISVVRALFWRPQERAIILFFATSAILIILLMMPVAAPVWQGLPLAGLVQFPWRLLALVAVPLALLSGLAVSLRQASDGDGFNRPKMNPQILLLGLTAVLASFPYTLPQYTPIPESAEGPLLTIEFELEYTDMRGMTAWATDFPTSSPLVEQYLSGQPLVTAEVTSPDASLEMIRAGGASDEMWVRSPDGTALRFFTYYFPGWRVYVDGERLPDGDLRPETGLALLTVDVPPGEHRVLLRWGDTPLRLAGKVLTVTCLAAAIGMVLFPVLRRKVKH
jgi:hypothetical protein